MIANLVELLGILLPTHASHKQQANADGIEAFAALLQQMQHAPPESLGPIDAVAPEEAVAIVAEDSNDAGAGGAEAEPPEKQSGPPHRNIPDVALPEPALQRAMHSSGAPFEPYRIGTPPTAADAAEPLPSARAEGTNEPATPRGDPQVSPRTTEVAATVVREPSTASWPVNDTVVVMSSSTPTAGKLSTQPVTVPAPDRAERPFTVVRHIAGPAPPPADAAFLPTEGAQHRAARAVDALAAVNERVNPSTDANLSGAPLRGTHADSDSVQQPEQRGIEVRSALKDSKPSTAATAVNVPRVDGAFRIRGDTARRDATAFMAQSTDSLPNRTDGDSRADAPRPAMPPESIRVEERLNVVRDVPTPREPGDRNSSVLPRADIPVAQHAQTGAEAPLPSPRTVEHALAPPAARVDRPVGAPEPIVQTAVHHVRHLMANGDQTVVLKLVPESLGELQITVKSAKDTLEVVLSTPNHQVRHTLEHQLHALRETLVREGFDVTKATVTMPVLTDNDAHASFTRPGNSHHGSPERQPANHAFAESHTAGEDTTQQHRRSRNPHQGRLNVFV